jgi:hypothetical protein
MNIAIRCLIFTIIVTLSNPTFADWKASSHISKHIKICRMTKVVPDGVVMLELSNVFQGMAVLTRSAAKFDLTERGKYGYEVQLGSEGWASLNAFAWRDTRGLFISFTQGYLVNMWHYVIPGMIIGDNFKIGASHQSSISDESYLLIPTREFEPAFNQFRSCVGDDLSLMSDQAVKAIEQIKSEESSQ